MFSYILFWSIFGETVICVKYKVAWVGLCGRTVFKKIKALMHACSFQTVKKSVQSIKPKLVLCKLFMFEATELQQRFILSLT